MSGVTQDFRDGGFRIDGQEDNLLVLKRLSGEEKLGRQFLFHVELTCEDPNLVFSEFVGRKASVWLEFGEAAAGQTRHWSGVVTNFRLLGSDGDGNAEYAAEIRPWFWLLTKTADCRIFQEMTVPDIIRQVFGDFGFNDFVERLSGTYRTWTYCVQYRETAFNFLSRLMEQEGIYYYFVHTDLKSELILADHLDAHDAIEAENIPFSVPTDGGVTAESITQWEVGCSVRLARWRSTSTTSRRHRRTSLRNTSSRWTSRTGTGSTRSTTTRASTSRPRRGVNTPGSASRNFRPTPRP